MSSLMATPGIEPRIFRSTLGRLAIGPRNLHLTSRERKFDSTAPEWRDSQSVPILPKDSKSCAFPVEILGMILGDSFDKEGKQRGCMRSAYSCDFSHQPSPSPKVLD